MKRAAALFAASALLGGAAAARAEARDWFRAFQYTARTVLLHGCGDCQGERDDVCEVRSGVQVRSLAEYARDRWPIPGRVKLLRSKADPDCAVLAAGPKGLLGPRASVEVAAVRIARAPPSAALVDGVNAGSAVRGWPRAPQRRTPEQPYAVRPQRSALRPAVVCWPSEQGWPTPATAGVDGRDALDEANACEFWLLSTKPDSGEPDLSGASFPVGSGQPSFAYGDARWASAFDPGLPLEETSLFEIPAAQRLPASASPATPPPPPQRETPRPAASRDLARCGDAARSRTATLDRFDQWDSQVRGSERSSLDRSSWTLNAGAWAGHCQELDVLRAALEQQLSCGLELQGRCVGAAGPGAEAR